MVRTDRNIKSNQIKLPAVIMRCKMTVRRRMRRMRMHDEFKVDTR